MTSKDRAFLRKSANTIETTLFIGKSGITDNIVEEVDKMILKRELIKGKVLENALLSAREVAEGLANKSNSQVVQVIGNKFVLYRKNKEICQYNVD